MRKTLLLIASLLFIVTAKQAFADTKPPILHSVSIHPQAITAGTDERVVIKVEASDSGCGIAEQWGVVATVKGPIAFTKSVELKPVCENTYEGSTGVNYQQYVSFDPIWNISQV